jgi:Immunity protein 63
VRLFLDQARAEIRRLAHVIGAPEEVLPTFGRTEDLARPHIEKAGEGLAWVVVERGQELERRVTRDLDELLYWTFDAITSSMASDWELAHRLEDQDSRILLFTHQLELLERLNPAWTNRFRAEHRPLLREVGLA